MVRDDGAKGSVGGFADWGLVVFRGRARRYIAVPGMPGVLQRKPLK